jgi:hypothetical protein
MAQLHQQHPTLDGLGFVGRQHLVEDRQHRVMLGREPVSPIATAVGQRLGDEFAANAGG